MALNMMSWAVWRCCMGTGLVDPPPALSLFLKYKIEVVIEVGAFFFLLSCWLTVFAWASARL